MPQTIQQKIIDTVASARHVLISSHRGPDGDSIGSQLGLAHFLRSANKPFTIVNEGQIPEKYLFLPDINLIWEIDVVGRPKEKFDVAFVVECSNLERIGEVQSFLSDDTLIINIDHHQDNVPFGAINWKDTSAAAAGEMIFELLQAAGTTLDKDSATNLYTALLTDTGRFQYDSTTAKTFRIAADLVEYGVDTNAIAEQIYYRSSPEFIRLAGLVLSGIEYLHDGKVCFMTVRRDMFQKAKALPEDTDGLINYSLYARKVRLGAMFTELDEDHTKVSFRSRNSLNVARIAGKFGGGGHVNSSGCVVNASLDQAKEMVLKAVEEKL